jgi:hypothetical protein
LGRPLKDSELENHVRRLRIFLFFALTSTASFAQMMGGGMMSTVPYFPLIDGARYDYVFMSGPHATATAVMHAGQIWGSQGQLTAMHMSFTCQPGVPCSLDATDFYRMDPDGMRHFGGDGDTAAGDHFMMTYANPEWMLKNPVTVGTMMGPGMYQGGEMWQSMPNGMNSMLGPQSSMNNYQAAAIETVSTPMGTFGNALHIREQRGDGSMRDVWYAAGVGMIRWMDGGEEAVLAAFTMPARPVPAVARAVEYYHAGLDHYFMTADPTEINALDSGRFAGWQRTGMSFNVIAPNADTGGMTSPVCRYYGSPAYGLDSHFYSASPDECAAVHRLWPVEWVLESSNVFQVYLPDFMTGTCPASTLPIYRSLNHRADTNHRYTIDARVQATMMGRGFIAEGYGNPPVAMCSPL